MNCGICVWGSQIECGEGVGQVQRKQIFDNSCYSQLIVRVIILVRVLLGLMNMKLQSRGLSQQKRDVALLGNGISHLNCISTQFSDPNNQLNSAIRNLKNAMPTHIHLHGYLKAQNKNRKMLPALPFKQQISTRLLSEEKNTTLPNQILSQHIRNSRNSQILNSLIQILKSDSDKTELSKPRNRKVKTEASYPNQFIETREISSVKNSRAPKIVHNQIMMAFASKTRRNLVSEQKTRGKFNGELNSMAKQVCKKLDSFDQMQMTFYKPQKIIFKEKNLISTNKLEQNQFITH